MGFDVVYADPPWAYRNKKTGGSHKSGAEQKYDVMSVEDIAALPVGEIANRDSVCFMWATVPMLPEALKVLAAWGYEYKTAIFWDKQRFGVGYWFRGQVEVLLFGVRGHVPAYRTAIRNIHAERSVRHSQKPEHFRRIIEAATPGAARVELFARTRPDGWAAWGNEIISDPVFAKVETVV